MQFEQLKEPYTGDWFLISEEDARLADHKDGASRRPWIVAGCGALNLEIPIVPRSTQPWPDQHDFEHAAHDGSCGQDGCAIDREGRIRLGTPQKFSKYKLTTDRWSCHEPSDAVLDTLIRGQTGSRKPRGRRR